MTASTSDVLCVFALHGLAEMTGLNNQIVSIPVNQPMQRQKLQKNVPIKSQNKNKFSLVR
jgi:hypothetical protein